MPSGPKKRKQAKKAKKNGSSAPDSPGALQIVSEQITENSLDSQEDQDDESFTPKTPVRGSEFDDPERVASQADEWVRVSEFGAGNTTPGTERPRGECGSAGEEDESALARPRPSMNWETVLQGPYGDRNGNSDKNWESVAKASEEGFLSTVDTFAASSTIDCGLGKAEESAEDAGVDSAGQRSDVNEPDNESAIYHPDLHGEGSNKSDHPPQRTVEDAPIFSETGETGLTYEPCVGPLIIDQTEHGQTFATSGREYGLEKFEGSQEDNTTEIYTSNDLIGAATGSENEQAVDSRNGAVAEACHGELEAVDAGKDGVLSEQQLQTYSSSKFIEGTTSDDVEDIPSKPRSTTEELRDFGFNELDAETHSIGKAVVSEDVREKDPALAIGMQGEPQFAGAFEEDVWDSSGVTERSDDLNGAELLQHGMDKVPVEFAIEGGCVEDRAGLYPEHIEVRTSLSESVEDIGNDKSTKYVDLQHSPDEITEIEDKEGMHENQDIGRKKSNPTSYDEVEASNTVLQGESLECSHFPAVVNRDALTTHMEVNQQETPGARGVSNARPAGKKEVDGRFMEHKDGPTLWKGCCGVLDWLVGRDN